MYTPQQKAAYAAYQEADKVARDAYNHYQETVDEGGDYEGLLPELTRLQREAARLREALDVA